MQRLEPVPSGAVAANAKQRILVYRIDPGLSGSESPHGFEPMGDRLFGTVHDRIGGQRLLKPAVLADAQCTGTEPVRIMTALVALKAVWPFSLE